MARKTDACEKLRGEFIRLLEEEKWMVEAEPRRDGGAILRRCNYRRGDWLADWMIVDFVLEKLRANVPLSRPAKFGPKETACQMKARLKDGQMLYIKLKIEDERVTILSFHESRSP